MAVAAKPEIARILLDLGIDPVDVYAVDNAEQTYIAALVEGINTLEVANKGESTRSRILREELKGVREKKRKKVSASKLFAQKKILPASKIRSQALLPAATESPQEGKSVGNILNSILNVLRLGNKQDKKESSEDRKERQRQRREKREKAIESLKGGIKTAASAGKKAVGFLISPFKKVWDALTNFLKFTLLGILINDGLRWFSDPENQRKITNLGRFFKDWWPSLLAGFLLFFTPIGTLVSTTATLLGWALPALAALAKNPLIAGAALFSAGALLPKLFPDLVKDEADAAVEESTEKMGKENTRKKLKNEKSGNFFDRLMGERKEREEQISNVEADDGSETRYGFFGPLKRRADPNAFNEGGMVPDQMNEGGMVAGRGDMDTVPSMLTPGELVIPNNFMEPMIMKPVNKIARSPVDVSRGPIKTGNKTIVLPTIHQPKPTQNVRAGTTIPVFNVASKSSYRTLELISLGIEEV